MWGRKGDRPPAVCSLIKKYGGDSTLSEFRNEVEQIKKSKEYEFNAFENNIVFEEDEEFTVNLPKNCHEFKLDNNKKEFDALKYLIDRGINEKQIKKHKLKYTTTDCPNRNFRNRIIIPSYDKFGNLNPTAYGGAFHNIEEIYLKPDDKK